MTDTTPTQRAQGRVVEASGSGRQDRAHANDLLPNHRYSKGRAAARASRLSRQDQGLENRK